MSPLFVYLHPWVLVHDCEHEHDDDDEHEHDNNKPEHDDVLNLMMTVYMLLPS